METDLALRLSAAESKVKELEGVVEEIRSALAGTDISSLPSDFPTVRMAHQVRADHDKFLWQVRDTCARAEAAERELEELRGQVGAKQELLTRVGNLLLEHTYTAQVVDALSKDALASIEKGLPCSH